MCQMESFHSPLKADESQSFETLRAAQSLAHTLEIVRTETAAGQVQADQLTLGIFERGENVVESAAVAAVRRATGRAPDTEQTQYAWNYSACGSCRIGQSQTPVHCATSATCAAIRYLPVKRKPSSMR